MHRPDATPLGVVDHFYALCNASNFIYTSSYNEPVVIDHRLC